MKKKRFIHSFMLARFQPLHNGHKTIIDKMLQESEYITIILGSAQESRTGPNPLTPIERLNLIENIYGKRENMKIFFMNDIDCDANAWYIHVMNFLKKNVPEYPPPQGYYCGDMNNGSYYNKGEFEIVVVDREKQKGFNKISATQIREMIRNNNYEWKNYIPKENHQLVEKYFRDLDKYFNNENQNNNNNDNN